MDDAGTDIQRLAVFAPPKGGQVHHARRHQQRKQVTIQDEVFALALAISNLRHQQMRGFIPRLVVLRR